MIVDDELKNNRKWYTESMKILIAPPLSEKEKDSMQVLTQQLCDFLGLYHEVAVYALPALKARRAGFYEAAEPEKGFFFQSDGTVDRTYEEELFHYGVTKAPYFRNTVDSLRNAICSFGAEVVMELANPAAIIAAYKEHRRCISFAHTAMVRNRIFPSAVLSAVNETLRSLEMDQILKLKDLMDYSERRILFAPESVQPEAAGFDMTRLGSLSLLPMHHTASGKVVIMLEHLDLRPGTLNKILKEAFLGAPYEVDIWYSGCSFETVGNLHYLSGLRLSLLNEAEVAVHDGNSLLFNTCMTLGIPQLIIHDTGWQKSWNAASAVKNGIGLAINQDDLDMAVLYESYRRLICDPYYKKRAALIAEETAKLGGLKELLALL